MMSAEEYDTLLRAAEDCTNELLGAQGTSVALRREIVARYLFAIPNEEWDEFMGQVELNLHRKEYPRLGERNADAR